MLGWEPWFWRDVSERATGTKTVDPKGEAACWLLPQHTPSTPSAVITWVGNLRWTNTETHPKGRVPDTYKEKLNFSSANRFLNVITGGVTILILWYMTMAPRHPNTPPWMQVVQPPELSLLFLCNKTLCSLHNWLYVQLIEWSQLIVTLCTGIAGSRVSSHLCVLPRILFVVISSGWLWRQTHCVCSDQQGLIVYCVHSSSLELE